MDSKDSKQPQQEQKEDAKWVQQPTAKYVEPEFRPQNKLINSTIRRELGWYLK